MVFVLLFSYLRHLDNSQQTKAARRTSDASEGQHQTNSGAARGTYRRPRANAFRARTSKELSRIRPAAVTLLTLPAASRSRCPGSFPSNTRAFGDGRRSLGDGGRVCFPLLLLQQSGSVRLTVCECAQMCVWGGPVAGSQRINSPAHYAPCHPSTLPRRRVVFLLKAGTTCDGNSLQET